MSEIIEKVQVGANLYEIVDPVTATLICDNVETTFYASKTYTKGEYIRINDSLYKATSNIASGQQMIEGVNITETNVGDELSQLNNDLAEAELNINSLDRTNHFYILDNTPATINANLVYAASQLSGYIIAQSMHTMMGTIEINSSDGHVFGSYWVDEYGTMSGIINAISTIPTVYSYVVSNGVCSMILLTN